MAIDDPVALDAWRQASDRFKPAAKRNGRGADLAAKDVRAITVMHRRGIRAVEIALDLGLAAKDVEALIAELDAPADPRASARRIIDAGLPKMATHLMETTHAPTMLEVMRDTGVTEKKSPAGEGKGGVVVNIGCKDSDVQISAGPGLPNLALPDPNK